MVQRAVSSVWELPLEGLHDGILLNTGCCITLPQRGRSRYCSRTVGTPSHHRHLPQLSLHWALTELWSVGDTHPRVYEVKLEFRFELAGWWIEGEPPCCDMSENLLKLRITKLAKVFEGFSSCGRWAEEAAEPQHVFHICSVLVNNLLHCVVHYMGMEVPLQKTFLLILQVGEDGVVDSITDISIVCVIWLYLTLNQIYKGLVVCNLQSQQLTLYLYSLWNPAFSWWSHFLAWSVVQQGGLSVCHILYC